MTRDSKPGVQDAPAGIRDAVNQRNGLSRQLVVAVITGVAILGVVSTVGLTFPGCDGWRAPNEIFRGVTYGCERLEWSNEGSGFVHWVRIDLSVPGIELYVTPMDSTAVRQGWQY